MFWLNIAIQAVPSACSRRPPVGSAALRSNTPMLSRPRKPPSNTLWPEGSLRFTHQVKFSSSLEKHSWRNGRSHLAEVGFQVLAGKSCEGVDRGIHVPEIPLIGRHLARPGGGSPRVSIRSIWLFAKSGSTMASGRQWNARSQAAYHGYSHLSGMDTTSWLTMWNQDSLRVPRRVGDRSGWTWRSRSHTVYVEVIALLGPQHSGQRLAHDRLGIVGHRRRRDGLRRTRPPRPAAARSAHPHRQRRHEGLRALPSEPDQHRGLPASRHDQPDMRRRLGPLAVGIHGVRAMQEMVA